MVHTPGLKQFITDIRESFMGDLLEVAPTAGKPVQLTPILNVHKDVKRITNDKSRSAGEEMMSYLTNLTLYITNHCGFKCDSCSSLYKQFDYCYKSNGNKKELKLSQIENILGDINGSALSGIKILGGNIFEYSHLYDLIKLLDKLPQWKTYYFHYHHLDQKGNILEKLSKQRNSINLLIPLPIHKPHFENTWKKIINSGIALKAIFVIQQEEDIASVQNLCSSFDIKNFSLRPFYNGKNLDFFNKYVFVNRDMVQKAQPSEKEIFSKMAINPNDFGNLIVLSNGNIHANINAAPLGKLEKDTLYDVIYKEMLKGKSWRRIRRTVNPCKHCTFELLCPPLSNYEYAIGANNLCHIRKTVP